MIIEAYIGKLNDSSFDFFGGNNQGNIPTRISPVIPNAHEILSRLWAMIRNSNEKARLLDWGAVGAIMTKQELIEFFGSLHNKDGTAGILEFAKTLGNNLLYVLVACETGEDCNE